MLRAHTVRVGITRGLVLASLLVACAHGEVPTLGPRTHRSAPPRTHFVPPFAYEAYVRGELALAANKPHEAVLQFELATAAPEEDAYLLSRLADAQAQAGEAETAHKTLAEAERVNPCEEQIWLTRGKWAEASRDLVGAEAAYRKARACAPEAERIVIALYRVWQAEGRDAEALTLVRAAGKPAQSALLLQAIANEDVAGVRFALDGWLGAGGIERAELERALQQIVARAEPLLALTFAPLTALPVSVATRAKLAELSLDRSLLLALLAQHGEQALGGAELAARFALHARDFERAELYAALGLRQTPRDALRGLRIEALSALGESEEALRETRALEDPATQRKLAREQLARLGLGALAQELETRSAQ